LSQNTILERPNPSNPVYLNFNLLIAFPVFSRFCLFLPGFFSSLQPTFSLSLKDNKRSLQSIHQLPILSFYQYPSFPTTTASLPKKPFSNLTKNSSNEKTAHGTTKKFLFSTRSFENLSCSVHFLVSIYCELKCSRKKFISSLKEWKEIVKVWKLTQFLRLVPILQLLLLPSLATP
jgi:hypothetical protein